MVDLPQQRQHPVRPGSSKEANLLAWVEAAVLRINRRHAKKFSGMQANPAREQEIEAADNDNDSENVPGYESFGEVAADIERVLDVLWVSNTPSIQVPYMITLAGLVDSYLRDFSWQARCTFALLDKLDAMLAALLAADEGEGEGEGGRKRVSLTERVRVKSLVEGTRVTVFDVRDEAAEADDDDDGDGDGDGDDEEDFGDEEQAVGRWAMAAARVYERSLSRL